MTFSWATTFLFFNFFKSSSEIVAFAKTLEQLMPISSDTESSITDKTFPSNLTHFAVNAFALPICKTCFGKSIAPNGELPPFSFSFKYNRYSWDPNSAISFPSEFSDVAKLFSVV
eukprot:NODE_76_length_23341_cov_0.477498.p11 type:complete len:115 gc:universal NODE_76_length_23341_cov_0.477498:10632-10976(+)